MSAVPTDAPPPDPITIGDAFKILFPILKPHAAVKRLNDAIVAGDAHLWQNDKQIDPTRLPSFFDRHLRIVATKDENEKWTAEISMLEAVNDFFTTTWTMSRSEVTALLAEGKLKKHAGGRPRIFDHDDIRATAFIVLARRFLKNGAAPGAIPDDYSANDLAGDVAELLDNVPGDTQLGKILDPLLPRIKSRLGR